MLRTALSFVEQISRKHGRGRFLGTNRHAREAGEQEAAQAPGRVVVAGDGQARRGFLAFRGGFMLGCHAALSFS
jgi:hypothetical protein